MSLHLHMLQWFVDQIFCPAVVKESALTPIQVKMTSLKLFSILILCLWFSCGAAASDKYIICIVGKQQLEHILTCTQVLNINREQRAGIS